MAKAKRSWTEKDYTNEAAEFVACYGADYCWDEFVYEYCNSWEHKTLKAPDGDLLHNAIMRAVRNK